LSKDEDEESSPACDVDLETGKVVRVLFGEVDLGSDDLIKRARSQTLILQKQWHSRMTHVSDTLEDEHDSGSADSLGRSSSVQVGPSVKKGCEGEITSQLTAAPQLRSSRLTLQGTEKHGSVVTSEQVVGLITGNLDEPTGTGNRREAEEAERQNGMSEKLLPRY